MASAAMDSPAGYPESPMDGDDMVYPCKGCGEILEEGKAFELAGNRWHIDCFRCNTCGTLLDSDANLLLLGDGSLICNNCTYSCNACGNKIEDLAILTGDQAFCSGCFRCRNCKRKIENLRYARTSQGIFCMSCHESLMARRRKKSKSSKSSAKEKALPSLPPTALPDIDYPHDESTDLSASSTPQPRSPRNSTHRYKRDASPLADEPLRQNNQTIPSSAFADPSAGIPIDFEDTGDGFLPMVLDPTPISTPPIATPPTGVPPRKQVPRHAEPSPPAQKENQPPRDYFHNAARPSSKSAREEAETGSSSELERERVPKPSSHILSQDKGRPRKRDPSSSAASGTSTPLSAPPITASSDTLSDSSTLVSTQASSRKDGPPPSMMIPPVSALRDERGPASPVSLKSPTERKDAPFSPIPAAIPARSADRALPLRGDSLAAKQADAGAPNPAMMSPTATTPAPARRQSLSATPKTVNESAPTPKISGIEGGPPPRSASRPRIQGKTGTSEDITAAAARAPPPPPVSIPAEPQPRHRNNASISTLQSEDPRASMDGQLSPSLLPPSFLKFETGFSMDDDLGRIMRGEKRESLQEEKSQSVLRRVSNAVKHGRSFSERSNTHVNKSSPLNSSSDVTSPGAGMMSPNITSPTISSDGVDSLRASLRRAQNHIAGLEAEKMVLEEKLNGSSEISAVNTELREKRSTMAILDTQREMAVRELEVMMEHVARAKDSNQPLDLAALKSNMLKDFAESLGKLKQTMSTQIEDLMHKRNELTEEIGSLIQMKDKGFQEYENLSNKNSQLMQHNNELLRSIQGVYQDNRHPYSASPALAAGSNGLGIYGSVKSDVSSDTRNLSLAHTDSLPQYEGDAEPATVLNAPQVVNIRKAKFNWRRGGEKMAKNVTKGLKGAFVQDKPGGVAGGPPYSIGMPYGATQQAVAPDFMGANGAKLTAVAPDDAKAKNSAGFFGQKNGTPRAGGPPAAVAAQAASVLFGSELSARCEFEGRVIPLIVVKCIQQVEARGMDVEGVYRKSGGAGQVKTVQQGFERDGGSDFDISDPDLDIHAITSALKQYFRKLPTPLIVYDVYDRLLEAGQLSVAATDGMTSSTITARNSKENLIQALRSAIADLPEAHRNTLQFLLQHLANVMSHEPQNLMTPLNLSVVFAPTIMRPESIEREMTDMQAQRIAVQALLQHHDAIFPEE